MPTYIVEFRLEPGSKNKIVAEFEERGPNRNPRVQLLNAWVGKKEDVLFAVVNTDDEGAVADACCNLSETGNYVIHPVINIEQY